MTDDKPHETFIPFRRADVIEMCLHDASLKEEDKSRFQTFCDILTAYYHFSFHSVLERLKNFFSPIDPDAGVKPFRSPSKEECESKIDAFYRDFERLLVKANFQPLGEEDLKRAFVDKTLIHLNIDVDLESFDNYIFYYRGSKRAATTQKILSFYQKEITFELFERVILLLKYKEREYFRQKGIDIGKLNFTPGRTYIFYYKNVPKADLEILFPNVKISMTLKDRLLFLLPAFGVGLSTLFKISTNLILIIGFILFMLGWTSFAQRLNVDEELIQKSLIPTIAALASVIVVLGGFAIKQYMNYKNKWVKFLNDVTQTLFFRKISVNAGVFQCLVDAAEEEECKEAILAYFHLLTSDKALTKAELDTRIERWFEDKFDTHIDFDVEDALEKLDKLKGNITLKNQNGETVEEISLISCDGEGGWKVLPLDRAILVLDLIWDNVFQYHGVVNPDE